VTKEFPKSETYSLTDQVRRSSRAVGAIVAEAWARRRYKGAFINKLNMAMAEAHETQSWLDHARTCDSCDYIEDEQLHRRRAVRRSRRRVATRRRDAQPHDPKCRRLLRTAGRRWKAQHLNKKNDPRSTI
jgi:four helix bundle protein